MKTLSAFILTFTFFTTVNSQVEWQEFLSHERSSSISNGHLFIDGKMHIAYNDVVKAIDGNVKPEIIMNYPGFMYQVKTTQTGINSKELLFLEAFDYDISGFGIVSLRNNNGSFWGKNQFGTEEFDYSFLQVPDGIISPSGLIHDQVINYDGNLSRLENGILETITPSPVQAFHEGLDDNFFAIREDTLLRYSNDDMTPVLALGSYDQLLNDPYTNSLVIKSENQLQWYSYNNFSLLDTLTIQSNTIGIQFIQDGLYQLVKTTIGYSVNKYNTSTTPSYETLYDLPFDEIPNFNITSFQVDGQDMYFVGINKKYGFGYHYVQKRRIGQNFDPIRQDLAIDTFSVNQINTTDWRNHEFSFRVRNNGTNTINSFAISSPNLPIFYNDYSFIRNHFDVELEPGETFEFKDSTNIYNPPSQISIEVTGVNYGFDSNPENDEYTTDIITLSNSNIASPSFDVYPNPSSNILNIKGDIDDQSTILIYDINGQIVNYRRLANDKIDISKLPIGIYNLVKSKENNFISVPFKKI